MHAPQGVEAWSPLLHGSHESWVAAASQQSTMNWCTCAVVHAVEGDFRSDGPNGSQRNVDGSTAQRLPPGPGVETGGFGASQASPDGIGPASKTGSMKIGPVSCFT